MASSSQPRVQVPLDGRWDDLIVRDNDQGFVPEPPMDREKRRIWESQ
ncbi:hypothetical protein A2U01_0031892, partial [Trifolium medium]|nr:hypothetical protein [Trifolium medium]